MGLPLVLLTAENEEKTISIRIGRGLVIDHPESRQVSAQSHIKNAADLPGE